MKKIITLAFVLMVVTITFFACNKEETVEGIYAPNGMLISTSQEDFTKTIAHSINVEQGEVAIESISFLTVAEGYVAEVDLYFATTNTTNTIYYISKNLEGKMEIDSSVKIVDPIEARRVIDGGIVAYCSCGVNSHFASSKCRVSVTTNPNGSVSGTCYVEGCTAGCVFRLQ